MNKQSNFIIKIIRNGGILTGLYFFSIWTGVDKITWLELKPVLIFLGMYILTEATNYYRIRKTIRKTIRKSINTLIF